MEYILQLLPHIWNVNILRLQYLRRLYSTLTPACWMQNSRWIGFPQNFKAASPLSSGVVLLLRCLKPLWKGFFLVNVPWEPLTLLLEQMTFSLGTFLQTFLRQFSPLYFKTIISSLTLLYLLTWGFNFVIYLLFYICYIIYHLLLKKFLLSVIFWFFRNLFYCVIFLIFKFQSNIFVCLFSGCSYFYRFLLFHSCSISSYFAKILWCIFKHLRYLAPYILRDPPIKEMLAILVLSFHLEGFLQLTSVFGLLAHTLYLRGRKQKAAWKLCVTELVNGWFHCRVVCLSSFSGCSEVNPRIVWLPVFLRQSRSVTRDPWVRMWHSLHLLVLVHLPSLGYFSCLRI